MTTRTLNASTKYAIVITVCGGSWPADAIGISGGGTYAGGNAAEYYLGAWHALTSDAGFEVWGVGPPIQDSIFPTWKDNWTDASNLTKNGNSVHFNVTLEDNIQGGGWTFSFYNGTEWKNNSGNWTGINHTVLSKTKSITAVKNQEVRWKWFFNDSAGNNNETTIWSFIVANSAPNQTNPLLKTFSGKNLSTEDLTCYNQSTSDADNDAVTNIYNWYKNSQPLAVLNMPFEINANDYSGNNNNNNNNGIINGAVFTDGKIGRALEFNGVNNTVSVDLPDFPKTAFTFEMWFNAKEFADSGRDLFTKYSANDGFRTLITSSGGIESAWDIGDVFNTLTTTGITANTWYHFVVTYNGSLLSLYLNGDLKDNKTGSGNLTTGTNTLTLGFNDLATPNFNGTIDELKIYNYALTPEQVSANHNLEYNKVVSQETTAGETYKCQVTPNDGEVDGATLNSSVAEIRWGITFNVTDSYYETGLNNVLISCNQTGFNQLGDTTNMYGPYGFEYGSYQCNFSKDGYYSKIITFVADSDKIINIPVSEQAQITIEEHTWLEWLYNCWHNGECWNLLTNINQTTTQIWQRLTGTDTSVITQEQILSYTLNATSNISINYTVEVPYKSGVAINELLPIRIYFWFTDVNRTTCYSQDKATDTNRAESPYCLPLVAEILGPNDGVVSFRVDLKPNLPVGTYNFTRSIEIDPLGVWTQYGREDLGNVEILNSGDSNIGVSNENRINYPTNSNPESNSGDLNNFENTNKEKNKNETTEESKDNKVSSSAGITGAVTGISQLLLSGWQIVFIITILCITFIVFVIVRYNTIKLKR